MSNSPNLQKKRKKKKGTGALQFCFTQNLNELKALKHEWIKSLDCIPCVMLIFSSTRQAEPIYRPLRSLRIL